MDINKIQDELEDLKSELWEYVEEGKTDLQVDIKDTMNYLLDLLDDFMLSESKDWIKEKCNTNTPPLNIPEPPSTFQNKIVLNVSTDELKKIVKEAVADELANRLYHIAVPYAPVQPYYCPSYPTMPNIVYTTDTKTTPIN